MACEMPRNLWRLQPHKLEEDKESVYKKRGLARELIYVGDDVFVNKVFGRVSRCFCCLCLCCSRCFCCLCARAQQTASPACMLHAPPPPLRRGCADCEPTTSHAPPQLCIARLCLCCPLALCSSRRRAMRAPSAPTWP